ncbi:hypothetical protein [Methylobacterium nodulans]|uniref:Uncharacterized protein n=1 Tax=Methylobacterium nodulans (strain LMG 21967 / CNCM I-2342 / ORS 2060) TaxID=460265 RepID=B8ISV9_METNO|nr:hypothetical protein [Methylobacterium nodulans]ACL60758.1 hypothetical protein Mnod_5930 [Methylobacterium nodulans ORS 2060]
MVASEIASMGHWADGAATPAQAGHLLIDDFQQDGKVPGIVRVFD